MTEPIKKPNYRSKVCPSCGNSFECANSEGCWCSDVKIPRTNLAILVRNFKDCLCPSCLNRFKENPD